MSKTTLFLAPTGGSEGLCFVSASANPSTAALFRGRGRAGGGLVLQYWLAGVHECETACVLEPRCTGYEWQSAGQCELQTQPISKSVPLAGYICKVRQDASPLAYQISLPTPTAAASLIAAMPPPPPPPALLFPLPPSGVPLRSPLPAPPPPPFPPLPSSPPCSGCLYKGACRDLVRYPAATEQACVSNGGTWAVGVAHPAAAASVPLWLTSTPPMPPSSPLRIAFHTKVCGHKAISPNCGCCPFLVPGFDVAAAVRHGGGPCQDLINADLSGRNLEGVDFTGVNMDCANLDGTRLKGAKFVGASGDGATFRSADALGVDFREAALVGADFRGADLRNAIFEAAVVESSSFASAKLAGSNFNEAVLSGSDFRGATGMRTMALTGAVTAGITGLGKEGAAAVAAAQAAAFG